MEVPGKTARKQINIKKGHQVVNPYENTSEMEQLDYDAVCDRHTKQIIMLYCPHHGQVGCWDCMNFDHKTCDVELISNMGQDFKDSGTFKQVKRDAEESNLQSKAMLISIQANKDQIKNVNQMFRHDAQKFRDENISFITKLADETLKYGDEVMAEDMERMDKLEKENKKLIAETSNINDTLRSLSDQPNKLFVSSITNKNRIQNVQHQIGKIKGENSFNTYVFERNCDLERSVKDCQQLGSIWKSKNEPQEETVSQNYDANSIESPSPPLCLAVLDRQLICKNLKVNGNKIRHVGKPFFSDIGIYIDQIRVKPEQFVEIEILKMHNSGSIAIGIVQEDDFSDKLLPGFDQRSVGYHSDGKLYSGSTSGQRISPALNIGDRIGYQVVLNDLRFDVIFTQNRHVVGHTLVALQNYHFAVGMKFAGDKIKVISMYSGK